MLLCSAVPLFSGESSTSHPLTQPVLRRSFIISCAVRISFPKVSWRYVTANRGWKVLQIGLPAGFKSLTTQKARFCFPLIVLNFIQHYSKHFSRKQRVKVISGWRFSGVIFSDLSHWAAVSRCPHHTSKCQSQEELGVRRQGCLCSVQCFLCARHKAFLG